MIDAEKTQEERELAHKTEIDLKKELAKRVDDAYKDYVRIAKEQNKIVADAGDKYLQLRNDFIKKYGSYHMSYTESGTTETTLTELLNEIFGPGTFK